MIVERAIVILWSLEYGGPGGTVVLQYLVEVSAPSFEL